MPSKPPALYGPALPGRTDGAVPAVIRSSPPATSGRAPMTMGSPALPAVMVSKPPAPDGSFEIEPEVLTKALKILKLVVERRPSLPILSSLLFEQDSIVSSNLDVAVRAHVPGVRALPMTVPVRLLEQAVATSRGPIRIAPRSNDAVVVNGILMKGLDAKAFPSVGSGAKATVIASIPELPWFASLLPTISTDPTRFNLSGIFLDFPAKTIVSTDGHRLHLVRGVRMDGKQGVILPRKMAEIADRIARTTRKPAELRLYEGGDIVILGDQITVFAKVVSGEFPDYRQVIPKKSTHELRVNRQDLIRALDAARPITSSKHPGIELRRVADGLRVRVADPDRGECETVIPCEGWDVKIPTDSEIDEALESAVESRVGDLSKQNGALPEKDLETLRTKVRAELEPRARDRIAVDLWTRAHARIGVNLSYLHATVSQLSTENVSIGVTDEATPLVLRQGPFLGLIMPMRL